MTPPTAPPTTELEDEDEDDEEPTARLETGTPDAPAMAACTAGLLLPALSKRTK